MLLAPLRKFVRSKMKSVLQTPQESRPDQYKEPSKGARTIERAVCWQKSSLVGFKVQDSDPTRQIVRSWINSFLGLD